MDDGVDAATFSRMWWFQVFVLGIVGRQTSTVVGQGWFWWEDRLLLVMRWWAWLGGGDG